MSTTVGNGLTVDGTVKASQATQAGEAVVLGDDGLIPASLLPNTGGETWERIAYDSTLVVGDVYKIRCIFGEVTFVYNNTSNDIYNRILYFPDYTSGSASIHRRVIISKSDNKIYNFESKETNTTYSFVASDATCRLYHLIE